MGGSLFASIGTYDNLDEPTPFFNHRKVIYAFVIAPLAISTICAFFRLYVRFLVTRCPGLDDVFVTLLLISTWLASIGTCVLVNVGLGKHFVLLGEDGIVDFVKAYYWINASYILALTFVKLALLTQYLRLFEEHPHVASTRSLRRITLALVVVTSAWGAAYSFLGWVPCVPIAGLWDSDLPAVRYGYGSQDIDVFVGTYISHASVNMALDVIVLGIPMLAWSTWNSAQVERKSRAALMGLGTLGGVATLFSISRFIVIVENRATTYPAFDPTWYGGSGIVLSVLEVNLATVVASLPVFWPHLRRNIDRIFVTHEVEVKITSSTNSTSATAGAGAGAAGAFNQIGSRAEEEDDDCAASSGKRTTHWPSDDDNNKKNSSGNVAEAVAMRDLKRRDSFGISSIRQGDDAFDSNVRRSSSTRVHNHNGRSYQHGRLHSFSSSSASHSMSSWSQTKDGEVILSQIRF